MKITDLKLLVDCAYRNLDPIVYVPPSLGAAKTRLVKARLLEENPQQKGAVRITMLGLDFVDRLLEFRP